MTRSFRTLVLAGLLGLAAVPAAAQQVVFNELLIRRGAGNPSPDQIVELRNVGTLSASIGGWIFCHELDYSSVLPPGLTLAPGAILTVHFNASGVNSDTDVYFPADGLSEVSDLALFTAPPFTSPSNMRAFVQFGGVPANGRQSVAAQANLWTLNAFIQGPSVDESVELCAADPTVVTSWVPQSTPTVGQPNGCGVPTREASWGSVKAIFYR